MGAECNKCAMAESQMKRRQYYKRAIKRAKAATKHRSRHSNAEYTDHRHVRARRFIALRAAIDRRAGLGRDRGAAP
jgi:hypothetical protein